MGNVIDISAVPDAFGPRAADYVTSAVHAEGADLEHIAMLAEGLRGGRALDLGCGGGHVSYRVAPFMAQVTACDPSAAMLTAVRHSAAARGLPNIALRQSAAEHLPFLNGDFDLVLSRFSTHHWRNAAQGLREARRVLRAGGRAVFVDVVAPADPLLDTHLQAVEVLRDTSHVRDYSAAEWVSMLSAAGLAVRALVPYRLRMSFAAWTARTRTPEAQATAIRALQQAALPAVRTHFAIEDDGSFMLDTLLLEAEAA